jgi:hypothetical protein
MRFLSVVRQIAIVFVGIGSCSILRAQEMPAEYQQFMDTLGKKGDFKANVLKVNIPRSDLHVVVGGTPVPTSFGFGGWLALTKGDKGNQVMMGDLVLLEQEVNPVMSAALENGLEVTALHNHFFFEQPRIFYMHVHGMGSAADLARKVKPAVDLIGKVSPLPSAEGVLAPQAGTMDTTALDKIVGYGGEKLAGGTYKYTIGRDDLKVKEMGAMINARMGLNTWLALFGSDDNAVAAGDVAMLEGEVQGVLKALRSHGLDVVAIHHHMTGTRPMFIFLHYWGKGRASSLAEGFRAALNELGKGQTRMKMEH